MTRILGASCWLFLLLAQPAIALAAWAPKTSERLQAEAAQTQAAAAVQAAQTAGQAPWIYGGAIVLAGAAIGVGIYLAARQRTKA